MGVSTFFAGYVFSAVIAYGRIISISLAGQSGNPCDPRLVLCVICKEV